MMKIINRNDMLFHKGWLIVAEKIDQVSTAIKDAANDGGRWNEMQAIGDLEDVAMMVDRICDEEKSNQSE